MVLKLPLYEENLKHTTINYISKKDINFLGHNKFFLRQLTQIPEEEFNKSLNNITDTIKQISKNIKDDKDIIFN